MSIETSKSGSKWMRKGDLNAMQWLNFNIIQYDGMQWQHTWMTNDSLPSSLKTFTLEGSDHHCVSLPLLLILSHQRHCVWFRFFLVSRWGLCLLYFWLWVITVVVVTVIVVVVITIITVVVVHKRHHCTVSLGFPQWGAYCWHWWSICHLLIEL